MYETCHFSANVGRPITPALKLDPGQDAKFAWKKIIWDGDTENRESLEAIVIPSHSCEYKKKGNCLQEQVDVMVTTNQRLQPKLEFLRLCLL